MKMIFAWLLLLASAIVAHADGHGDHSHLPPGGRPALHGMVLYGSEGSYFLDHIPMNHAPHDFQVVAQVKLKDKTGSAISGDFSNAAFTLKPATNFSLNDYVAGRLKKFKGTIHSGSFEQGGPVVKGLDAVEVEVELLKLARQIPAESTAPVVEVSSQIDAFELNVITPARSFQSIKNKRTGKELWCVKGPNFFEFCD